MTLRSLSHRAALASGLALLFRGGLALAEPVGNEGWGLPPDASADGWRVDWLIHSTMAFVLLLFVIMTIWMVTACIRYGKHHQALYDHGNSKRQLIFAATLSALIFAVVDGNLFVNTMVDLQVAFWNFDAAEKLPGVVRIEVNAHQWAWQARYAGPDGKFNTPDDIVTLNDFRVPQGAPIILELASTDVIHSLYLPNFRVKQDAMPGMVTKLWFRPKDLGEYDLGCAQHCGVNHYKMKALLTVLPKADYARWVAEASANSQRGYDPADAIAHWGWDWKNPRPIEGDSPPAAVPIEASKTARAGATSKVRSL